MTTTLTAVLLVVLAAGWAVTARMALLWWRRLHTDALTGLANRERLVRAFRRARRHGGTVGVLLLDLDRFKQVNDTHGHAVGNLVLRRVALRLAMACTAGELAVRLHGDEFAVLLTRLPFGHTGALTAQRRAAELAASIAAPIGWDEESVAVSATVGAAVCFAPVADLSALMRAADQRMYARKSAAPAIAAPVAELAGRWLG